jgi:hypothetical protein
VTRPGDPLDPVALAAEIDREIRALPAQGVQPVRAVRRAWSRRLRPASAEAAVAVAMALVDRQRWVAYELLSHHPGGLDQVGVEEWSGWGRGWPTGGRSTPSAARSRDRFGGGEASRTRPCSAGRPPRTGGGGGLRWSRRCRSTSGPGAGPGTPGAPWTSAGGWPPTMTTWWSRRCRGRSGSWSSGIPRRCGGSWTPPRGARGPGQAGGPQQAGDRPQAPRPACDLTRHRVSPSTGCRAGCRGSTPSRARGRGRSRAGGRGGPGGR